MSIFALVRTRHPLALVGSVAVVASLAVLAPAGCGDDEDGLNPFQTGTSGSNGGATGTGGATEVNLAEQMFHDLEEDLIQNCGACHKAGGSADTAFLGDPDSGDPAPYDAITSWPGIIVKIPEDSVLITWPKGGAHLNGPTAPTLEKKLLDWLAEEAKSVKDVTDEENPTVPPFKPIVPGFNAVYLNALGPDYLGMAVTFQAEELTEGSLNLTSIQVQPTSLKGLKVKHPLFTVFAKGSLTGEPDPVDSFSNVEQSFEPNMPGALGPGSVILTNWSSGAKLAIAFETIELIDPTAGEGGGGGGSAGGCNAVQAFQDNAQPALQNGTCPTCHGGNNQAATNAVDMSELGTDPAATCVQIRNRVTLDDPPASQLFITTDPNGNAAHPYKFGGNATAFNTFVNAVTVWINAEAQ